MKSYREQGKCKSERGNSILRIADRYGGIPAVYLLGKLRKKTISPPVHPKRIAFLKTAAIGDTILISGPIMDMKKKWPDAEITFFVGRNNSEVATMLKGVDKVTILPIKKPLNAIKTIRDSGKFDLWLDFGSWPRLDAIFSTAANAAFKVGFTTEGQYRHYGYDKSIRHSNQWHELENYRNLIRAVKVSAEQAPFVTPDMSLVAEIPYCQNGEPPYVIMHMFPGGSRPFMKEWPVEYWVHTACVFLDKGWRVVFTGTDSEHSLAATVIDKLERGDMMTVNLASKVSLPLVASVLAKAGLVISVNTGIMHLSAAVNAPLVVINGPTSPTRWGPISKHSVLVTPPNMPCAPCLNLGFEYKCSENRCMKTISPELVLDAAKTLIK